MVIQPTSFAALAWAGAASGSAAESWRIGTVLAARPLGVNPQGMLVLQIGALAVETEAPRGQLPSQFQVRVLSLGAQPQLEVIAPNTPEPASQLALRERLPQQNGYAPLLATLDALSQRPALRQLPAYLRPALALLEHGVRTPAEITRGEGLAEAIKRSGLFLEAELAQPHVDMAGLSQEDWKGALLRLASLLDDELPAPRPPSGGNETPPPLQQRGVQAQPRVTLPLEELGDDIGALLGRLHGEVHAALARVEVAQLEATTASAWMIEIPLQGEGGRDILQLQLQHGLDAEAVAAWTLGFALDLPSLGPVQGELQLRDLRLSVRLWAERGDTVHRLEQQFGALRQQLASHGLILDQLSCQRGLPHASSPHSAILLKTMA
ncbi:flagellar hook-length control protein FliK [Dyella solisilvae]|uniref:Flagellar hook-length control protein FliK n=1 Tax=Dyella solisilvae TaxID=1920168 RepID=A0A370K596_9GAMM|nr:flagellar hook-length control protein FliK [Dyella solisilvae]RDI97831.1 flagellar hook-length control protein FliK [Dyella solisilvae]